MPFTAPFPAATILPKAERRWNTSGFSFSSLDGNNFMCYLSELKLNVLYTLYIEPDLGRKI